MVAEIRTPLPAPGLVVPSWMSNGMDALKAVAARGAARRPPHRNGRRFLVIHLDGLSRKTLLRAVEQGRMPFMRQLLTAGGYRLTPAYAGSPSSTPAFQAGLLWGVKGDIPGFLWYDKRLGRELRMDRKADAIRVERQVARGRRGLLEDGTTYFSIFDGGSCVNAWTFTGWAKQVTYHSCEDAWDYLGFGLAHSVTAARVITRMVYEAGLSLADVIDWAGRTGRLDHETEFYKNRILLSAGAREFATFATMLDIARGVPSIYTCFADYDEVAHRRGPESPEAMRALESMDGSLATVMRAVTAAGMNYDVYLLADHGQVETRPFESVTGSTLKDYMTGKGCPGNACAGTGEVDGWTWLANLAKAARRLKDAPAQAVGGMGADLWATLAEDLPEAERLRREVVCVDAGDLAHVYFTSDREPLPLEAIQARYGALLEAVTTCPAVGLVAVRGGRAGLAYYRGKRVDLADPESCKVLDLGYRRERVVRAISDMLAMRSSGDLVCYGNAVEGRDVAFAWEFGSHGGLAADAVETFVIHPERVEYDFGEVEHARDLYRYFTEHYRIDLAARVEH